MARAVDDGTIALWLAGVAVGAAVLYGALLLFVWCRARRRARSAPGPARPSDLDVAHARRLLRTFPVLDPIESRPGMSWAELAMRCQDLLAAAVVLDEAYRAVLAARAGRGCQCGTCVQHGLDGWLA